MVLTIKDCMAKKSLLNLSMDADFIDLLKQKAKDKGVDKLSDFVAEWLKKLGLEKGDVKRVILQIPQTALDSKVALETWLHNRSNEIVNHYFANPDDVLESK